MSADPVVFVVDDDQAIRSSLEWLIESVGLGVETYATPAVVDGERRIIADPEGVIDRLSRPGQSRCRPG